MTGIDNTQPAPTAAEVTQFWRGADFPPAGKQYPAVQSYAAALMERFSNGSVVFASFQFPEAAVVDWYLSRDNPEGMLFLHRFWHAPAVKAALEGLQIPAGYENDPPFRRSSSFALAGELAVTLYHGGAYHNRAGSGAQEMGLAQLAADELIQNRYGEVLVFTNHAPWAGFFYDVAWDVTWALVDKRERLAHVLCATDTD